MIISFYDKKNWVSLLSGGKESCESNCCGKDIFTKLNFGCQDKLNKGYHKCFNKKISLKVKLKSCIYNDNPISAQCCVALLLKNIRNPKGFLIFAGGIEMQHWAEMGFIVVPIYRAFSNCYF